MTQRRTIARRIVLAGLIATVLPGFTNGPPDEAGLALDDAAKLPSAEGLARLATIDPGRLTVARRLDVTTARAGLAIDAAIAARTADFALQLRRTLGDGVEPAAATRRLDAALADLHARAAHLFDRIGIVGASVGARYERLFAGTAGRYPEADGRTRAVADMTRTLAGSRAQTPRLIAGVPPFCLDVSVRALTPVEIAAGKQGHRDVPAPGRPGTYVVDLRDIPRRPAWSLPSVVAHELLPGHMIQLGIEEAAPPHPLRLRYASAFVEGWATYAETLVAYPDPRAMLGHLHWLIFRAARGRVDLGIHHEGWSPATALARLAAWQGVPVYFAAFDPDVVRIIREPGIRAAEALAWLTLVDRAPRSAAARRRWHAAVLANGRKRLEDLP